MTQVLGIPAGPDGVGGSFQNDIESDRTALWYAQGGRQGVLSGLTYAGVGGLMALDLAAGAALVAELDGSGNAFDRGYLVRADATTRVTFGAASASNRNDALVAAFVDTEDGAVGTGALAVGAHLVVIPGVSGTTTVRTDAQIRAWLGRGGYVRLADVPIASTDTQINTANITVPTFLNVRDTGWVTIASGVLTGTFRYRILRGVVYIHADGAVSTTSGVVLTLNSSTLPSFLWPDVQVRIGAYLTAYPGFLTMTNTGNVTALQSSGTTKGSVSGMIVYPLV